MRNYPLGLLSIAVVAAILGGISIALGAAGLAKAMFVVCLLGALASLVARRGMALISWLLRLDEI